MENAKSGNNGLKLELALWALGSLIAAIYAYII